MERDGCVQGLSDGPVPWPGPATRDLVAALCARLCHDLASAAGGLVGMLEMASEAPDTEALALALACARELSGRLRLLRAAWGNDAQLPDLASLLPGLPGAANLSIDLTGLDPVLDGGETRLVLGLLMAAAGALPRGGTIKVAGGSRGVAVTPAGPLVTWPGGLLRCLASEAGVREACRSPREVGFALTWLCARDLGLRLTLSASGVLAAG